MKIQNMFLLRNSWQYFSMLVLLGYQSDTLGNSFKDQMKQSLGELYYYISIVYTDIPSHSYFRRILFVFSSVPFYTKYVHLPTSDDAPPAEIQWNPKFWPFFKDVIGAIDSSHIHCVPPAFEQASHQNRKGWFSQNCLFACNFCLVFIYALTGWEGSATDARVWEDALEHDLIIPAGKYFLADAGFPLCDQLLVPY